MQNIYLKYMLSAWPTVEVGSPLVGRGTKRSWWDYNHHHYHDSWLYCWNDKSTCAIVYSVKIFLVQGFHHHHNDCSTGWNKNNCHNSRSTGWGRASRVCRASWPGIGSKKSFWKVENFSYFHPTPIQTAHVLWPHRMGQALGNSGLTLKNASLSKLIFFAKIPQFFANSFC